MVEKADRQPRRDRAHGVRLRLISGDRDQARHSQAPLRILGSEPRLRGAFRLTDR